MSVTSRPIGSSPLGGVFLGTIFFVTAISSPALTGGSAGVAVTTAPISSGSATTAATQITPLVTNAFTGQGSATLRGSILGPESTLVQICNGRVNAGGSSTMIFNIGLAGSGSISLGGNAPVSRTTSLLSVGLFQGGSQAAVSYTLIRDTSGKAQTGGSSLQSQTVSHPVEVSSLLTSGTITPQVDYYIKPVVSPNVLSGSVTPITTTILPVIGGGHLGGSVPPVVASIIPEPYYVLETDGFADVSFVKSVEAPAGNIFSEGGAQYGFTYTIPDAQGRLQTQGSAVSFPCYNPSYDSAKLLAVGSADVLFTTAPPAIGGITTSGSAVVIGTYYVDGIGGPVFNGSADISVIKALTVQGNITSKGTSIPLTTAVMQISGGMTSTGAADYTNHLIEIPQGGPVITGISDIVLTTVMPAEGSVAAGGVNNTPIINLHLIGEGSVRANGSSDISVIKILGTLGNISSHGSALLSCTFPIGASGSATTHGSAEVYYAYGITPQGGTSITGQAPVSYSKVASIDGHMHSGGFAPVSITTDLVAQGGIQTSSECEVSSSYQFDPDGQIGTFVGNAPITFTTSLNTVGGFSLSGQNEINILLHKDTSGAAVASGSAIVTKTTSMMSFGLLASAGTGIHSTTIQPVISGSFSLRGGALLSVTKELSSSGGVLAKGSGNYSTDYTQTAGGGTSLSGGAQFINILNIDISGRLSTASAAPVSITKDIVATGSARLSGSGNLSITVPCSSGGSVRTGGIAQVLKAATYTAQGLSFAGGTSFYTKHMIMDVTGGLNAVLSSAPVSSTVIIPVARAAMSLRGFGDYSYGYNPPVSGSARTSGTALHPIISLGFIGAGKAQTGGYAPVVKSTAIAGLGLLNSGGNVTVSYTAVKAAGGNTATSGSSPVSISYQPLVTGKVRISSSAIQAFTHIHQPIGGTRIAGIGRLSSTTEFTLLGGAMTATGNADYKFVNIREVFAQNFTSSRKIFDAAGKLISNPDKQLQNKWKWGENAFIHHEDLMGITIPFFADAPVTQSSHIQPGVVDGGLNLIDKTGSLILAPGMFSTGSLTDAILPSESITQPLDANTLTEMHENPDLRFPVLLRSFKYLDGKLVTNIVYICDSDLASDYSYRFKITNGIYSIETKTDPATVIDTTLSPAYVTDTQNVFVLPEFPAIECNFHDTFDYELDNLKGLIYTAKNITGIHITYYAVPLLSYVPVGTISQNALWDLDTEADSFITLRNELTV